VTLPKHSSHVDAIKGARLGDSKRGERSERIRFMRQRRTVRRSSARKAKVIYLLLDGERIAYRGKPNTPQAGTWVPMKLGY
jgi:hypothetical protein